MNPIETKTELEQRNLAIRRSSSAAVTLDQKIAPVIYSDSASIKYVIGAPNTNEQYSILKKIPNTSPATSAAASKIITNSITKAVTRPEANVSAPVKISQQQAQSVASHQVESKQISIVNANTSHSLIKLPTIKNQQGLAKKTSYKTAIKGIVQKHLKQQAPSSRPIGMQATASGHIIQNATKNGHSTTIYPEMIASSLLARSAELPNRKLPTLKDVQKSTVKRMETNPLVIITSRENSEPTETEVTQISSTVTLTKAGTTTGKQLKSMPSPLVTIEKKGSSHAASLLNPSKQSSILFPKNADPMDIVVNTFANSKTILTNNDSTETHIESGQKSLLIKQPSPPYKERTPPKQQSLKPKQQSLLKVNSLARLLHTSPRTKRSKSLTAIGNTFKKRKRIPLKRRLSAASEGEISLEKTMEKLSAGVVNSENKTESPPHKSLLCNDAIETIPTSTSNSSLETTVKIDSIESPDKNKSGDDGNSAQLNTILEMFSAFNMLTWKYSKGSFKGSKIKFHLNEFNLLQIAEKCPPRDRVHMAYEKPIYERESSSNTADYSDPLYLCRQCNCHGAAVDFLAPGFCSYECYRRESRKRSKMSLLTRAKMVKEKVKRARKLYTAENNESDVTCAAVNTVFDRLTPKRVFTWCSYLSSQNAHAAPIDLFLNPFPCGANLFEVNMKLEAIDPENNWLFCVCTVVKKQGFRLKLKFDGYSKVHNFWVNADSMDVFPPGWCAKTNRVLQPPYGMNLLTFNWPTYLTRTKSSPAPRSLFTHLNSSSSTNPFEVGLRLEAADLKNAGKVCVASIADVLDNRVLIHFDGWDASYDYWIDINSPYIHPVGWHKGNKLELVPPPEWEECFSWQEYLEFTQSKAAPPRMFSRRDPIDFTTGMKLEVVDVKNPCLIRPATVLCRNEYKILLHLDGWPNEMTFWVNDDSPDIHPIGWAKETGHHLEPPPGFDLLPPIMPCPVKGCRGIGNAKRLDLNFHCNVDTCPYTTKNWDIELERPPRLGDIGVPAHPDAASSNQQKYAIEVPDEQATHIKTEYDVKALHSEHPKQHIQDNKSNVLPSISESIQSLPFAQEIQLSREYLCDYGPRLKQNYLIWRENSNFNPDAIKKNPLDWTTKETSDYISTECHPIGHLFQREDIDGVALLSMQQSDLTDILKIRLGPAIKIFSHVLHLRNLVVSRFLEIQPLTDS